MVKYQVIIGAIDGKIRHVYGPIYGSVHDARIYDQSGIGKWLFSINEKCLGDRGYQGCLNVISPHKTYDAKDFTPQEKIHNSNVGKYRHTVERLFAALKKWGILRQTFRGSMESHYNYFMACCVLCSL